jgi:hypothetical protein
MRILTSFLEHGGVELFRKIEDGNENAEFRDCFVGTTFS